MLQVVEGFVAKPSPCHQCEKHGQVNVFPDCAGFDCREINSYLLSIGEKPYINNANLSLDYPPGLKRIFPSTFCTETEYLEASERLKQLKIVTKLQSKILARKIGIPATTFNSILRASQKVTAMDTFTRIMGFRV